MAIAERFLKLALIPAAFFAFAACNTVAGIGEDTQAAGAAIEDAAE